MIAAGIISTNGTALVVTMVATWVVFWGAFSAVVFGIRNRPGYWWLAIGVVGPIAPLVALVASSITSRRQAGVDV